jgi:cytochrome c
MWLMGLARHATSTLANVEQMWRKFFDVIVVSCLVVQPAIAQVDATPVERGQALLIANCSGCHAIGRTGTSPRAGAPPFRTLSEKYPIESLAEALAEGLSVGHPDMPEFVFEPNEIGAILDYLKSIQGR